VHYVAGIFHSDLVIFLELLHYILRPFNGLFSRTTWVSRHQKG